MSEYNINEINKFNENTSPGRDEKSKYLIALLAGMGVSVIVGIIWAVIGIWLETEYMLVLGIGVAVIAGTIHFCVPENSIIGAIIGAILCPATYLIYQFIMALYGYYYEDNYTFWLMLVGSFIAGAWFGYNND